MLKCLVWSEAWNWYFFVLLFILFDHVNVCLSGFLQTSFCCSNLSWQKVLLTKSVISEELFLLISKFIWTVLSFHFIDGSWEVKPWSLCNCWMEQRLLNVVSSYVTYRNGPRLFNISNIVVDLFVISSGSPKHLKLWRPIFTPLTNSSRALGHRLTLMQAFFAFQSNLSTGLHFSLTLPGKHRRMTETSLKPLPSIAAFSNFYFQLFKKMTNGQNTLWQQHLLNFLGLDVAFLKDAAWWSMKFLYHDLATTLKEFMYRYILYLTEKCYICFCISNNKERNGCVGKITGYFGYWVICCLSSTFASPCFWAHSGESSMPRDAFAPVLLRAMLEAVYSQGLQLSDEVVASYQTGYLKTASCKQFPPTPVSLPIHFAGCLFQWSVIPLPSRCSGSTTKISAPHLSVWEVLLFFGNSTYLFFMNLNHISWG